jgi:hypothetical protein
VLAAGFLTLCAGFNPTFRALFASSESRRQLFFDEKRSLTAKKTAHQCYSNT